MGAVIVATGISNDPSITRSIGNAAAAGTDCLAAAGVKPEQVDILINVGVYRDKNMVEPAMAALIQKEIGINLDFLRYPSPKTTFSFDLMNGACGILNGVQTAEALLQTGSAEFVLIVSSDAHPSGKPVPSFPYIPVGAAMLLTRSENGGGGFGPVQSKSSLNEFVGLRGVLEINTGRTDGRERISLESHPEYEPMLLVFAESCVREYVMAQGIDLSRTLLVTSQAPARLGSVLASNLGMSEGAFVSLSDLGGTPHTSSLTLGYAKACAEGLISQYEQILFVAAGAGLSCSCAVYQFPRG